MKLSTLSLCSGLILSSSAFSMFPHVEVMGGGGITSINSHDSSLFVTSSEIDQLHSNGSWYNGIYQLGVGTALPFVIAPAGSPWFSGLGAQLNAYHISDNIHGEVYRFGDPAFHDLNYTMALRSTRLMVDGVVNLFGASRTTLYGKGGIGAAWNRTNYQEESLGVGGCSDSLAGFGSHTSTNFAWEAGVGVKYNITEVIGVSAEYLHAGLGDVASNTAPISSCLGGLASAQMGHLSSDAGIFKLHWIVS